MLVDRRVSAGTVIRSAWRLASALRGDLVAVAVVPNGGLDAMADEDRAALERQLHLAEDLGATVRVVEGEHIGRTIAARVREENAQLVVLGHYPDRGWRHFFGRSLVDQLLHLLDHVDIHVVELKGDAG